MHTDALVVRCHGYAESSAVVVFLTSACGTVRALAKGAKRAKNSFRGPIDKGVLYRVRLGRARTEGLSVLYSASVRESFPRLRVDPARFHAAALILEIASDLLRENEPHEELFRLCVFSLKVLDKAPDGSIPLSVTFFLARAVTLSGHTPELSNCLECGLPVLQGDRPLLSPLRGGVLHAGCAQGEPGARTADPDVLALLRELWSKPAGEALELFPPAAIVRGLRRLLVEWLQEVLERRFLAARPLEREISSPAPPRG